VSSSTEAWFRLGEGIGFGITAAGLLLRSGLLTVVGWAVTAIMVFICVQWYVPKRSPTLLNMLGAVAWPVFLIPWLVLSYRTREKS